MTAPVLITGGAGFIGSALVRDILAQTDAPVVVVDKLTYAGREENLGEALGGPRLRLVQGDVADRSMMRTLLAQTRPRWIFHLAAESHVDRSINDATAFITTNVVGTFSVLEAALDYWQGLAPQEKADFRLIHVSTDEVFGSLPPDQFFSETSPHAPNSPYAASKAGADHLARAWHHTYGLPVIISNCSNNYGPRQFPEKLIPLMIAKAQTGETLPVYGDGGQIRDWLYVDDHARALRLMAQRGQPGEVYCVGGGAVLTNLEVLDHLCAVLDDKIPLSLHRPHKGLIRHVEDRPGHDRRYAMQSGKIRQSLGWEPRESFVSGLGQTVDWYLNNSDWVSRALDSARLPSLSERWAGSTPGAGI